MWPERRAADPDEKDVFEAFSIFGPDLSGVKIRRKLFDAFVRLFDICAKFRARRQRGITEPIMTDHSPFVGIGDCSRLQLPHRCERFVDLRLHFLEEIVRKFHPADVDGETEFAVVQKILLKTLPARGGRHCVKNIKNP